MKTFNYKKGIGPLMIILIIAIVIIVGGGIYYAAHKSQVSEQTQVQAGAEASTSAQVSTTAGTLKSLLALGGNLICTVSESNATSSVNGTIYVSGTMMRGDFTTSSNGGAAIDSHMIKNGDTVYAWSGSQGAKMSYAAITGNPSVQSHSNVNLNQSVNYSCKNSTPAASEFSAPTNINFYDMTSAVTSGASAAVSGSAGASVSAQCSACNALTGSAKSQCMSAFHC